ncbi:MAG: hypothetical protein ACRD1C_01575 [Terriglobales bacterium]
MATTVQAPGLTGEGWEEFLELEARIQRVAQALKQTRTERDQALSELAALHGAHEKLQRAHAQADQELVALRKERLEVRKRLTHLSQHLEAAQD